MEFRKLQTYIHFAVFFQSTRKNNVQPFLYLTDNNILYKKQFGFQTGHSTEHAIIQLIDQIKSNFENDQYALGVFIDLLRPLTLLIIKF